MLADVAGGLAMARRRWVQALLVSLLIALPSAVLSVYAAEIATQINVVRAGVSLREQHAVAFDMYDNSADGQLDLAALRPQVEDRRGYATTLFGAGSNAGYTNEGHQLMYIIGDAPRELFPSLHLCQPAPCSMRGHDIGAPEEDVDAYGSRAIAGQDVLPAGAALLAPNAGIIRLDDAVVLVLPASVLSEMSRNETEDAASSAVLLDPTTQEVDRYVDDLARQGAHIVPRTLEGTQGAVQQSIASSGFFLLGTTAFLILVLSAFVASVLRLVGQERRHLAIRRMYGSSRRGVQLRLGTFIAALGAGPTMLLVGMRWFGDPAVTRAALAVLLVLAIVWVSLWIKVSKASAPGDVPLPAGGGL